MKKLFIVFVSAMFFSTISVDSTLALTGPFDLGGQYNPINISVQEDYTQQGQDAMRQFTQTQNLISMQAINEPVACAYIVTAANSFIQTSITQHDSSPAQEIADANQLNYYYNLNSQCIAQQCPTGYSRYPNSNGCVTPDQECKATFGPYGQYVSLSGNHVSCTCSSGYAMNSSGTQCVASISASNYNVPVYTPPAQSPKTVVPAPASQLPVRAKSNNQICKDNYGSHSVWTGDLNASGGAVCSCSTGYEMVNDKCTLIPKANKQTVDAFGFHTDQTVNVQATTTQRHGFLAWLFGLFGY